MLIYILAKSLSKKGKLNSNTVVGTSHTNTGLLIALNRQKINLIRTDIGDKYVIEAMEKMNLSLGGEQSGHIILRSLLPTGDGILSAIKICETLKESGGKISQLFDAKLLHQLNKNIVVADKLKILNSEMLSQKSHKFFQISRRRAGCLCEQAEQNQRSELWLNIKMKKLL